MKKRKQRVAIIGTVGVPACYGGFETLAEHLIEESSGKAEMTVYCSSKKYKRADRKSEYKGARLTYIPFDANGIQSVIYDSLSILHALLKQDVLLVLGVAGAWLFPFIRLFTNKKIIVSIDGIEWKRDKWNRLARLFLWWSEGVAVRYSHIDISDNESIQDYTAQRYGTLSQIIEYGADHTMKVRPTAKDKSIYPFLRKQYAFKVCRIEPENNVHTVLESFAEMPSYRLVMVGNWDKSDYSSSLRKEYSKYENIHLLDPIYDQRELDVLRSNALIYIHGHSAGGTNPSLVEAMYLGLPIIAFRVSYNVTTTMGKALYFSSEEDLSGLVKQTKVAELRKIGKQMEEIAQWRYTWKVIAEKYNYLIQRVSNRRPKDEVVPQFKSLKLNEDNEYRHLSNSLPFYENA